MKKTNMKKKRGQEKKNNLSTEIENWEWKQNHATSAFVLDKVEFAWLFFKNFRNLEKSFDILFSFSTSE